MDIGKKTSKKCYVDTGTQAKNKDQKSHDSRAKELKSYVFKQKVLSRTET